MPDRCAGISLSVAIAVRAKAVWLLRLFTPKLLGQIGTIAKAFHAKAVVVAKAFCAKAV